MYRRLCYPVLLLMLLAACKHLTPVIPPQQEKDFDDPGAAAAFEFYMLRDPATGRIPAGIREEELKQAEAILNSRNMQARTSSYAFTSLGPSNIGGRTRAVVYDIRYNGSTNLTMFAGGVSGGIFKSMDDGASWTRKTPTGAIHSVTSIAQDPRPGHQDTWYYGTGEYFGANINLAAPPDGDGVFRSLNNGETWTRLPASNPGIYEEQDRREDHVERIVVDPVQGFIYMAASAAIIRSTDGGDTWAPVLMGADPNYNGFYTTDIICTATGRLYAAFSGYNSSDVDGIWTSASGNEGSWTRIAGEGNGGFPAGWDQDENYGRIVLALTPSQQNLYAFVQSFTEACTSMSCKLFRYDALVSSWTDLSNNLPGCNGIMDPLNVQGGYNMTIAVKPDDPNVVLIGGTNLYRSTNGFTTNDQVTEIGGYNNQALHPDMHWLAFKPGDPNFLVCGNDGGLQSTSNVLAPFVQWNTLNHHYNTVQFYYVTIDPRPANDKVMGGAQDNGTLKNIGGTGAQFEMVGTGDGCAVGLSNPVNGVTYEYTSYQAGGLLRRNSAWPPGQESYIVPNDISFPVPFVTLFLLDPDNTEYLYYVNRNRLYRTTSASTVNSFNWTEMLGAGTVTNPSNFNFISALATTRGNYDPETSSLFIANDFGKLFRLDDPIHASVNTVPVEITGPGFTDWAYISSISVNPRNDDTVMVTCSNYNVLSIWWTGNANAPEPTWINVERNLTKPSVRSSAIAITDDGVEYFIGTSVGLFSSSDPINQDWVQEGVEEIGNAVVRSLALRPLDNKLLIGTYGNGMWATTISSAILPVTLTGLSGKLENGMVYLDWETGHEVNVEGFTIERSRDGIDFDAIGHVPATGAGKYYFQDPERPMAKNYYRLGIRDHNGMVEKTKIILVRASLAATVQATSPFHHQVVFNVAALPQGKTTITVYDVSGRQVARKQFSYSGQTVLHIDVPSAAANGLYFARLVASDGQVTEIKLMKN